MELAQNKKGPPKALLGALILVGSMLSLGAYYTVEDPTVVYGACFAVVFGTLAFVAPEWAAAVTFAVSVFQEDLSSGVGPFRFSIGEICLLVAFMGFIYRQLTGGRPIRVGPTAWPILLYLGLCAISSVTQWRDSVIPSMLQMFFYFVIAQIFFSHFTDRPEGFRACYIALVVTCGFLAVMEMISGSAYILGLHKNGIGASLAGGLIVASELYLGAPSARSRMVSAGAVVLLAGGLVLSLSRGAWGGALAGLFALFVLRGQLKMAVRLAIVLLPIVVIVWRSLPAEKQTYAADFNSTSMNIDARYRSIDYARLQWEQSPVFGNGVGLRKEYDATNVVWTCLAETGVLGLAAFLLIHFSFARMCLKSIKLLPKTDPLASSVVIGAAGILNVFVHGLVDHYWSRGILMASWAGAGMATAAWFRVKNRVRGSLAPVASVDVEMKGPLASRRAGAEG